MQLAARRLAERRPGVTSTECVVHLERKACYEIISAANTDKPAQHQDYSVQTRKAPVLSSMRLPAERLWPKKNGYNQRTVSVEYVFERP